MESIGENSKQRTYIDKHGNKSTMNTTNLGQKADKPEEEEESIQDKIKEVNQAIRDKKVSRKELTETQTLIWATEQMEPDLEKQEEARRRVQANAPSRICRICTKMDNIIDDLTMLADGTLEIPEEDLKWVQSIIMKGPNWILQFHKLGVNLEKVYNTLINPKEEIDYESKRKEGTEWNTATGAIDITPEQDDGEHLH